MNITEIRVKMVGDGSDRLRAFCSVTFDGAFVIRDLKIIDGINGPFVAMPSRKLTDRCIRCGNKNHLRARFCDECGAKLDENRAPRDEHGRIKLHADIAHPINAECRGLVQDAVIEAFEKELALSKQAGYRPRGGDFDGDDLFDEAPARDDGFADGLEPTDAGDKGRDRAPRAPRAAGNTQPPAKRETEDSAVCMSPDRAAAAQRVDFSSSRDNKPPADDFASGIL